MSRGALFDDDGDPYPENLYNGAPPREPRATSETSGAAADSVSESSSSMRTRVLAVISRRGPYGATDDEIEVITGYRHQTASARRRELVLLGRVADSERRRATRSGRSAVVWVLR